MLVILEGPDGTGKTRLWEELRKRGYHTERIEKQCWYDCKAYALLAKSDYPVICDRSFISDAIYSYIEDREPRFTVNMIDKYLANSIVVYCVNPNAFDEAIARGEDNITDRNTHNTITNAYNVVMRIIKKYTNTPVITYDYHVNTVEQVVEFINKNKGVTYGV